MASRLTELERSFMKICNVCGAIGFPDALAICQTCRNHAEHIYCMKIMVDEILLEWHCAKCKAENLPLLPEKTSLLPVPNKEVPLPPLPEELSVLRSCKVKVISEPRNEDLHPSELPAKKPIKPIKKPSKVKYLPPEELTFTRLYKKAKTTPLAAPETGNEQSHTMREKPAAEITPMAAPDTGNQQPHIMREKAAAVVPDEGLVDSCGKASTPMAAPDTGNQQPHTMREKPAAVVPDEGLVDSCGNSDTVPLLPEELIANPCANIFNSTPCWKGKFEISAEEAHTYSGLTAFMGLDVANQARQFCSGLPETLKLKIKPQSLLLPKRFQRKPPDYNDIALCFSCEQSWQDELKKLIVQISSQGNAMVAFVGGIKVLIFPSDILPEACRKVKGQLFLWAVFVQQKYAKSVPASCEAPEVNCTQIDMGIDILRGKETGAVDRVVQISPNSLPSGAVFVQKCAKSIPASCEAPEVNCTPIDMDIDMLGGKETGAVDRVIHRSPNSLPPKCAKSVPASCEAAEVHCALNDNMLGGKETGTVDRVIHGSPNSLPPGNVDTCAEIYPEVPPGFSKPLDMNNEESNRHPPSAQTGSDVPLGDGFRASASGDTSKQSRSKLINVVGLKRPSPVLVNRYRTNTAPGSQFVRTEEQLPKERRQLKMAAASTAPAPPTQPAPAPRHLRTEELLPKEGWQQKMAAASTAPALVTQPAPGPQHLGTEEPLPRLKMAAASTVPVPLTQRAPGPRHLRTEQPLPKEGWQLKMAASTAPAPPTKPAPGPRHLRTEQSLPKEGWLQKMAAALAAQAPPTQPAPGPRHLRTEQPLPKERWQLKMAAASTAPSLPSQPAAVQKLTQGSCSPQQHKSRQQPVEKKLHEFPLALPKRASPSCLKKDRHSPQHLTKEKRVRFSLTAPKKAAPVPKEMSILIEGGSSPKHLTKLQLKDNMIPPENPQQECAKSVPASCEAPEVHCALIDMDIDMLGGKETGTIDRVIHRSPNSLPPRMNGLPQGKVQKLTTSSSSLFLQANKRFYISDQRTERPDTPKKDKSDKEEGKRTTCLLR